MWVGINVHVTKSNDREAYIVEILKIEHYWQLLWLNDYYAHLHNDHWDGG